MLMLRINSNGGIFRRMPMRKLTFLFLILITPLIGSSEIIFYDTENGSLISDYVKCAAIDKIGNKWIGTENTDYGSLNRFTDDSAWYVFTPGVMPSTQITSMAFDTSGNLWIGTLTAGLYKYNPDSGWQSFAADTNLTGVNISSIAVDSDNQIWIGTFGAGLRRFDGDSTWIKYTALNGLNDDRIISIFADNANCVWVGTYNGINLWNGSWQYYDSLNSPLPGNTVRAFAEDRSGNIWIGTNAGAARLDQSADWTIYDTGNSGLASNQISAITVDSSGYIWFGHRGTSQQEIMVSQYRGGISWQTVNLDHIPSVLYVVITCAVTDHTGNLWFGTSGEGVVLVKIDPTAVADENKNLPAGYTLGPNYPNPFNPGTSFEFSLPVRSAVTITIYDILGRKIRTLLNDNRPAGVYRMQWDGLNDYGRPVSTGIYFYRMATLQFAETRKMLLIK